MLPHRYRHPIDVAGLRCQTKPMNIDAAIHVLNQHFRKPVIIGAAPVHGEYDPNYEGMFLSDCVDSARGVYAELAIDPLSQPTAAREIADALDNSIGNFYIGYKGGDYMMRSFTELWVAPYGDVGWRLDDIVVDGDHLTAILGDW